MKKPAVLVLTAGLTFSSIFASSTSMIFADEGKQETKMVEKKAEETISKQDAIKIANDFFDMDFKDADMQYDSNWYMSNSPVWHVQFQDKKSEQNIAYYRLTVDATNGSIYNVSFSHYNNDAETTFPPKITWEEGKMTAFELISSKFSNKIGQIKFDPSTKPIKPIINSNTTYNYHFNRKINGVVYPNNNLSVQLNGNGDIISYNFTWDPTLKIPNQQVQLSQEEALKAYKDYLEPTLQYKPLNLYWKTANEDGTELVLAYDSMNAGLYLDATTGKFINMYGKDQKQEEMTMELVSENKLKPIRNSDSLLTKEQALASVNKFISVPDSLKLDNVSFDEHKNNSNYPSTWSFRWTKKDTSKQDLYMYLELNAKTGEVNSFSLDGPKYYNDADNQKITLSVEDAKEKAIEAIKNMMPSKADQVSLINQNYIKELKDQKRYYFQFERIHNGIPMQNNGIYVNFSAVTGELLGIRSNWTENVTFPSLDGVISKGEATNIYLERFNPSLQWVPIMNEQNNNYRANDIKTYRKVYVLNQTKRFDEPVFLNAKNGDWYSMTTGEKAEFNLEATDIDGLKQEKALQLMISYGAIKVDENGKVYPQEDITRGEMVKMLMLADNPDPIYFQKVSAEYAMDGAKFEDVNTSNAYFPYIEDAIRKGYIDTNSKDFNPEEKVTRYELAKLLVKALGYDELTTYSELFKNPYTDLDKTENIGVVSLVHYLKIMPDLDRDNKFEPESHISRANASQVFYQYLIARSQLK